MVHNSLRLSSKVRMEEDCCCDASEILVSCLIRSSICILWLDPDAVTAPNCEANSSRRLDRGSNREPSPQVSPPISKRSSSSPSTLSDSLAKSEARTSRAWAHQMRGWFGRPGQHPSSVPYIDEELDCRRDVRISSSLVRNNVTCDISTDTWGFGAEVDAA